MVRRALVLVADELDHLLVDHDALVDAHGERLGVGLGIVDRDVDLQRAEVRTPEPLGHLQRVGVRAAVDIEPAGSLVTEEVRRLDDERVVAFIPAARVAEPPRRRVVVRRRPSIHVDVAQSVVRLVGDQHQVLRLHDLTRLRMVVVLHQADRQTPHVRIVLHVVGHPLLLQLRGPGCHRQRIATARDFTEGRERDASGVVVGAGGAPAARPRPPPPPPRTTPDAGKVDFPVSRARRRSVENRLAVLTRNIRCWIRRPLCAQCGRQGQENSE